MPTSSLSIILAELPKLRAYEVNYVAKAVEDQSMAITTVTSVSDEIKEKRFTKGVFCPHCSSKHTVRNGKAQGKQRYLCKDCGKSFGDFTNSTLSGTKSSYDKWFSYMKCMVKGYSLRQTAAVVGISLSTAFCWRHKILTALGNTFQQEQLAGVIEADETFFLESFKGNHNRSSVFTMPRPARKRGGKATRRGISVEQVCVTCAIDRAGHILSIPACKGRVDAKTLDKVYAPRMDKSAVLCTDKHRSYVQFAKGLGIKLVQLKNGKAKQGLYHIQHINSYHSNLKGWLYHFKGLSTKRLLHYLYWFQWLKQCKELKEVEKANQLFEATILITNNCIAQTLWHEKMLFS